MTHRDLLAQILFTRPWAIKRSALAVLVQRFLAATSADLEAASAGAAQTAMPGSGLARAGAVAVIPIRGVISYRPSLFSYYFGGTTVLQLQQAYREALADETVQSIVFDVDSPGGMVDGIPEFAAELFKARGQKRTVAVVNTLMASGAYWIGSQMDEVVMMPSGEVGSIGVFIEHADYSKLLEQMGLNITLIFAGAHKVDGNPYEPLNEAARADLQASVDETYRDFLAAVARGRDQTAREVRESYGDGRVFGARDALKLKMVDRLGTLDELLAKLTGGNRRGARAEAAVDPAIAPADSGRQATADPEAPSTEPAATEPAAPVTTGAESEAAAATDSHDDGAAAAAADADYLDLTVTLTQPPAA